MGVLWSFAGYFCTVTLPQQWGIMGEMCDMGFPVSSSGWRVGKGEGFADMEYAMMVAMGAVTEQTVVVTVVHDCQVSKE